MKPNLSEIKALIQSGNIEKAGQQLLEFAQAKSSRLDNDVIGQLASLKQVLTDERKGIASPESIKMQKNRITYALLELIDEIDEELSSRRGSKSPKKSGGKDKDIVFDGPIGQVIIQQSRSGDNVIKKKEKVIEIGDNAQISAPVVIADSIENSFNALAKSTINDETKSLLEQLLKAINEINKQSTPETAESAESLVQDAESLVKEVTSAKPRRKWYEVSIEGLKQAAINIGEVATPVLEIVGKLTPLLLG
jgi:hypothetical protein